MRVISVRRFAAVFFSLISSVCLTSCASVASNPKLSDYSEQTLMLDNGSYQVPGLLVKPTAKAGAAFPVIVMLHGTASQKNEVGGLYQRLAVYLAERGYASLRIDFAGTGDIPVDYQLYNLTSAKRDATTALNYLGARNEFNNRRMGLIGFSQGGLIAQLMAASDARIRALVTWSSTAGDGAGTYQSFVFDQHYSEAQRNGFAQVQFPWREQPLNFGLQWFEEVRRNTSLSDMTNYHGDFLAIAGTADTLVPYASSLKLVEAVGSSKAAFHLIKNADHMFNVLGNSNANGLADDQSTAEEALMVTAEWIVRHL